MPDSEPPPAVAVYSDAERAAIVDEFLASPQAQGLPAEAAHLARLVVDFGADEDAGGPLRVSPAKTDLLFDWGLAHDDSIDEAHRAALGVVYTAWVRWAAARTGLPEAAGDELAEVVAECVEHFAQVHAQNIEEAQALAMRYLGDVDDIGSDAHAATLRRRLFAVLPDGDLPRRPMDPAERRRAIAREHVGAVFGPDGRKAHLTMHETVVTQLWDDDPPEVWAAVRRLLDSGLSRHDLLHEIGAVLVDHSRGAEVDIAAYRKALDALGQEPAGA
jgi:hypothetical protein